MAPDLPFYLSWPAIIIATFFPVPLVGGVYLLQMRLKRIKHYNHVNGPLVRQLTPAMAKLVQQSAVLTPYEQPLVQLVGDSREGLIATDQRLIIVKTHLGHAMCNSWYWSDLYGIEMGAALLHGHIAVKYAGAPNVISGDPVAKAFAPNFFRFLKRDQGLFQRVMPVLQGRLTAAKQASQRS